MTDTQTEKQKIKVIHTALDEVEFGDDSEDGYGRKEKVTKTQNADPKAEVKSAKEKPAKEKSAKEEPKSEAKKPAKEKVTKAPKAVLMGDSITDGWPKSDNEFFESNNFVGRGISGQTTSHMVVRFRQDVVDLHPKYVVILAGTNDIAQVHRCSIAGYHIILSSAILASIIVLLGGEMVFSLLTNDAKVIDIAVTLIIPWILYQFGDATQITYANALRGIKCVMPMMKYAFISYVVVGTSSAFLFAFTFNGGVKGVILSFAVTLFVAGALFTRRFYKEIATTSKVAN